NAYTVAPLGRGRGPTDARVPEAPDSGHKSSPDGRRAAKPKRDLHERFCRRRPVCCLAAVWLAANRAAVMTMLSAFRHASVRFILVTLVIDALGFGLVVPIIPPLVVHLSGESIASASLWLGALLSMFALMQFFCSPILGGLSDRFGRRPVLLLSLSGMCANYLLLAWAPSLACLFLGRLIAGATAANASTANAYIADVTPPQLRAARFGLVGASFGIGFVVGPALGGVLGSYGLRIPFLVAAALAACNLLYGAFVLESLPPERRRTFD